MPRISSLYLRVPALPILVILGVCLASATALSAQTPDSVAAQIKALEERIRTLEAEVQALKAAQAPPAAAAPVAALPAAVPQVLPPPGGGAGLGGSLPVYGGAASMAKVLNPDISVIGDFIASAGHNPVQPIPSIEMHESEVGFQAIIDPYARGDFFISFGEQGVNLEEGYITFTSLPAGFVAKAGKFRAAFGKVNTMHNHVLPWVDRPLVSDNLTGGEDGINDAGFSVTRAFAGPRNLFLEATGQVLRGDSEGVFTASRKSDLSVVGHLRAYKDLTESTNLDIGGSYSRGHNDFGSAFITDLYGTDATLRWKPLRRAIYHSFLFRTELVWRVQEQPTGTQHAFGLYASPEYRVNRRWTLGGRYDRSERATNARLLDSGASAVLTYWPSEFSQLRWQYRFARYAGKQDANELLVQFQFSLGAHGAHPF
jgi:hypothetical protein